MFARYDRLQATNPVTVKFLCHDKIQRTKTSAVQRDGADTRSDTQEAAEHADKRHDEIVPSADRALIDEKPR